VATAPWRWEPSPDGHARAVAACVERIAAGDLFQANLCLRLSSTLRAGEAVDVFARTWRELRPVQAAWVAGPWGAVASLSPESFLRRAGRRVQSAPIKGTRPRTGPPEADAEARAELLASAKDGAEHVMIVDLVRNDLGRVCVPGSVRVAELAGSRPAPGVWHLVSTVAGELRPGIGDAELVRAAFPPGSVTGAPKVAALRAIGELESTGREAYTGALGLASPLAGLDLNVAIRTFEVRGRDVWLGAGGGIVADSDGAAEAREAAAKAAPLLAAIGGRIAGGDGRIARAAPPPGPPDAPGPPRVGPVPLPRPHPEAGLFETVLVRAGRAQHLPAHLDRLAASALELFGLAPPAGLADELRGAARRAPDPGRLRVDLWPEAGALRSAVAVSAIPPAPPPRLRAICVPGGPGAHKLADRRLWDGLAAAHPGELVLAVDLDGHVLETARAAVLAELGGVLVAPPLDGRILPGITRARMLAAARAAGRPVAERPLPSPSCARRT
jgi:para-aminobenzoate synthetase/4-amino-4-deoxychorismate lyase